jgi:hypothetical protein
MLKTLRIRHFVGAIAAILGVAALAVAASNVMNPWGACALEEVWPGGGWATVTDGTTSSCGDLATGLLWSSSAVGRTHSYWDRPASARLCADLVEGGHSDWRLPTIKEIQTAASHDAIHHVSISFTDYITDPNNPTPLTMPEIWASETKGKTAYMVSLVDGTIKVENPRNLAGESRCVRP